MGTPAVGTWSFPTSYACPAIAMYFYLTLTVKYQELPLNIFHYYNTYTLSEMLCSSNSCMAK